MCKFGIVRKSNVTNNLLANTHSVLSTLVVKEYFVLIGDVHSQLHLNEGWHAAERGRRHQIHYLRRLRPYEAHKDKVAWIATRFGGPSYRLNMICLMFLRSPSNGTPFLRTLSLSTGV